VVSEVGGASTLAERGAVEVSDKGDVWQVEGEDVAHGGGGVCFGAEASFFRRRAAKTRRTRGRKKDRRLMGWHWETPQVVGRCGAGEAKGLG